MLGPILALTAALASTPEVELAAGVRSENRAGIASVVAGLDPTPVADFVLVPSLSLGLLNSQGGLRFSYMPRIFQRVDQNPQFRPLLFQQFEGVFNWRASETWNLGLSARGGIGSVNYTYITEALGNANPDQRQDVAIAANTLSFGNLVTGLTSEVRLGPTTRLRFGGNFQYTAAIDNPTNLATQIRASAATGFTFTPNGRDGLDVVVSGDYADFVDLPSNKLGFITARVGWIRTMDRRTQCTAHVGALLLLAPASADPVTASPAGDLGCTFGVIRSLDVRGNLAIQLGVQGYADPARATVTPRAVTNLVFNLQFPPDWTAGIVFTFYTPIAGPLTSLNGPAINTLPETLIEGRLPITYRVGEDFMLEAGARFLTRGPRFTEPAFRFGSLEAQGYFALSFGVSTRENRHQGGAPR